MIDYRGKAPQQLASELAAATGHKARHSIDAISENLDTMNIVVEVRNHVINSVQRMTSTGA